MIGCSHKQGDTMIAENFRNDEIISNVNLFSAWIESQMAYNNQPGLSIAVVHDQEIVWAEGFGYANMERQVLATPYTLYRIGSITKLFTSVAILQLRDEGKLILDAPIEEYLPWFAIQKKYPIHIPITIRNLLTHTSGLPREADFSYWADHIFPTRAQIKEKIPQQETFLMPETVWKYSNLGFFLLGEIIMELSGYDFSDYINQYILKPLGMNNTYVSLPDIDFQQFATGYGRRLPDNSRESCPVVDCLGLTPVANFSTTVKDLARFAMFQLRNDPAKENQVLNGRTLREMQRVHWLDPSWLEGRGLGIQVWKQENKTYIGHIGAISGFSTLLQICLEDKIAVVTFINAYDGDTFKYSEKAFKWIAPAILNTIGTHPQTIKTENKWKKYEGKYRNEMCDLQVFVFKGQLVMFDPSEKEPENSLIILKPVDAYIFQMEAIDNLWENRELLTFEMDKNDTVQKIKIGGSYFYPISKW